MTDPIFKAENYFSSQEYEKCILTLQNIPDTFPENVQSAWIKTRCFYRLNKFHDSSLEIKRGLTILLSKGEKKTEYILLYLKFLDMKLKILEHQGKVEEYKDFQSELFEKLELGLSQGLITEEDANQFRNTNNSQKNDDSDIIKPEAKKVYEYLRESMKKSIYTTEFNIVHLISMKWFRKWATFTGFDRINSKDINNSDLSTERNRTEFPGPIDASDILEADPNHLLDPDNVKEYTNYRLKLGLEENKDFFIVSHATWKYLSDIYKGTDIKRYVISLNDESNSTGIEIWLKKITLSIFLPTSQEKLTTVYLSKKETIKELRDKIIRIFRKSGKIEAGIFPRFWKIDSNEDYKEISDNFKIDDSKQIINGKKLSEATVIEEAEIGDEDIILCEFKINNQWKFVTREEHAKIQLSFCGCCGKKNETLLFCECKTIKYCDAACQHKHRPDHKEKCNKIKNAISKTNELMRNFKISKSAYSQNSMYGITGLQNLGNTCFMNSSLQCLSHVYELTNYFLTNQYLKDLNKENRLGTGGRLAVAYGELMKELWHGSESYISPWDIKKIIAEVASQFSGYNQQDAQEFLSYLLDGLHEDLNLILKKPYIETIEYDGKKSDEVFSKESWENHQKRNKSVIVDLMHGQYRSELTCPDCKKISITFDPFMTVSLPIPNLNYTTIQAFFIFKNSKNTPYKMIYNIQMNATSREIIKETSEMLKIPEESFKLKFLKEQVIIDSIEKVHYDIKQIKDHPGAFFIFQIHDSEIDVSIEKFLKSEKVEFELHLKQKDDEDDFETVTFSRITEISIHSTFKDLHHQIYLLYRRYILNYFTQEKKSQIGYEIVIENSNIQTLEKEYQALQKNKIYSISIQGSKSTNVNYLPYNDKILSEYFKKDEKLHLDIILNSSINYEPLRLNKCLEFDGPQSSKKDENSYSLNDCFSLFSSPEVLDKDNLWFCNKCKDHKQATKQMSIYKVPRILVLHLKRFKTSKVHSIGSFYFTGGSQKINTFVEYPLNSLDLSKYVKGPSENPPIYDLFAVVNHYGSLSGGHYTAYGKNPFKNKWYDFNDSRVSGQSEKNVVTESAYLLFYRQRDVEKK